MKEDCEMNKTKQKKMERRTTRRNLNGQYQTITMRR